MRQVVPTKFKSECLWRGYGNLELTFAAGFRLSWHGFPALGPTKAILLGHIESGEISASDSKRVELRISIQIELRWLVVHMITYPKMPVIISLTEENLRPTQSQGDPILVSDQSPGPGAISKSALRRPSIRCSTSSESHHFPNSSRATAGKSGLMVSKSRTARRAASCSPSCA